MGASVWKVFDVISASSVPGRPWDMSCPGTAAKEDPQRLKLSNGDVDIIVDDGSGFVVIDKRWQPPHMYNDLTVAHARMSHAPSSASSDSDRSPAAFDSGRSCLGGELDLPTHTSSAKPG